MKKVLTLLFCTCFAALSFAYTYTATVNGITWIYWVSSGKATIGPGDYYSSAAITIPSTLGGYSVTSIGNNAFAYCDALASITIPSSVTSIGNEAFAYCDALASITIPSSVTSIGNNAFLGCTSLTSVTIPSSVTSISNGAFSRCSGLKSVTIPSSVTSIGEHAFSSCSGLTSVHISDIAAWCSIQFNDSFSNPLLYAKKLYLNESLVTDLEIPSSVTSIGYLAFASCSGLTSVTIPEGVTSIGNEAFAGCSGLTSVTIPSSVTSIGERAFRSCSSLTSVTIPSSVTSISNGAFSCCSGLKSVTIPSSVTSIGYRAFDCCSSLTSVTIPSSVTSIGDNAFSNCFNLYKDTNGVRYESEEKVVLIRVPESMTGSFTIPNSVRFIHSAAFYSCTSLTSVTIPSSVTTIGEGAFSRCERLTSVTIPSSVTTIGERAFSDCYNLTSVTIPSSVTTIGEQAFSDCDSLTSIYFKGTPPSVGSGVFYGVSATGYYSPKSASAWESVIDSEGKWNGLVMTMGSPTSSLPTYRVPIPHPAATFTATAVGEEQVTLKVTAQKGYVFAGWYTDDTFTKACDSFLADYRNPTYTYNIAPDNLNFNALFVTAEEDTLLDLVGTEAIPTKGSDQHAIQLVIDSYSLPKVSATGLPAGMKFTATPVMVKGSKTEVDYPANTIYGTPTKPGIYTVKVSLTNTTITKAITKTFDIEVPNLTAPGVIDIDDWYGEYIPGVSHIETIPGAEGCTVTGLPAGMKWTAKDVINSKTKETVPANSVYGVPTTPGNYTVYFTKTVDKVKYTATATFKVGPYPQLSVTVNDEAGGKVTGTGGFAANKTTTLKATPNKGYVFAGWYEDEYFSFPCDSTSVDYRNPSYTYVMGEYDAQFYARFVTKEEEQAYSMTIELVDEFYSGLGDYVTVRAGEEMEPVKVWVDSLTLPTATVTGLPTGLKFDAKTFTISGKPTKPGYYPVTIEAKNASKSRTAFTIVNFEVRHFNAHGFHGYWEDAEPFVVDAFTTETFALDDYTGVLDLGNATIKSLALPTGLTYNARTGEIKGNGTLTCGTYVATLTDTLGRVTTFTIVAELAEADRFTYIDYLMPSLAWGSEEGMVQGAYGELHWMEILKSNYSWDDWDNCYFDMATAQAISVKVTGLPSGLNAYLEKDWWEHWETDENGHTFLGKAYQCKLYLEGKTSVAPGDYPVTVTITNSRTGQVEYVSSVIHVAPPPSIQMKRQLSFTSDEYYDKKGNRQEAHAVVTYTINGTSATASYRVTLGDPNKKPIVKSGTVTLHDMTVIGCYTSSDTIRYEYDFYTATSLIWTELYFEVNEESVELSEAWLDYCGGASEPIICFGWDGN